MTSTPIITLLTDFGGRDAYVAAMKGVIATLAPDAHIIDAAHDIPAHDIQAAAWTLMQYWSLYPKGTIHLAIVDPGVGTSRKALCIEADERLLIVPDNGIASLAIEQAARFTPRALKPEVHRPGPVSPTFHGRDIFAYAAGLLLSGQKQLSDLTDPVAQIVTPPWAKARATKLHIEGEIIHADHFGNLITNICRTQMPGPDWAIATVRIGAQMLLPIHLTYSDVPPGAILALFGSTGTLEIAVNAGSAQTALGCGRGTKICVQKGILARTHTPA